MILSLALDNLREATARMPYWSERRYGASRKLLSLGNVADSFVRIVDDLAINGYFEQVFPSRCVDDNDGLDIDPSAVLWELLGAPNLWPFEG